jgi:hypothetical protein
MLPTLIGITKTGLNFQQQFTRGYDDQNASDQNHKVSDLPSTIFLAHTKALKT